MNKAQLLTEDLGKAIVKLNEALAAPYTELNRDATIQRFEFTFELSWKLMHAVLTDNGIEVYGPKNSIREAARLGMTKDPEKWLVFLHYRNLTTHKYDEATAEDIYQVVRDFPRSATNLLEIIQNKFLTS